MKPFIFLILITWVVSSAHATSWQFHREYGDTSIYKSQQGQTRLVINFKNTTQSQTPKFTKELLKKLKADKKRLLEMIGITKWKISGEKSQKKGKGFQLSFNGSYVDNDGQKVFFKEYHFYLPSKKLQLLLTNNSEKKLKKDWAEKNISGFRIKYGF